jgi:ankyrin repeat protein
LGLSQYNKNFQDAHVDLEVLKGLNDDEWREVFDACKVPIGARLKIMKFIRNHIDSTNTISKSGNQPQDGRGARTPTYTNNGAGDSPLMTASAYGDTDVTSALLAAGANVNHTNKFGESALVYAAANGHTEVALSLLANGANVNHTCKSGSSPLNMAAAAGHTDMTSVLLTAGANINHTTNAGNSSLILAAGKGHPEVVQWLLHNGADKTIKNKAGETAFDHARLGPYQSQFVARFLQ